MISGFKVKKRLKLNDVAKKTENNENDRFSSSSSMEFFVSHKGGTFQQGFLRKKFDRFA